MAIPTIRELKEGFEKLEASEKERVRSSRLKGAEASEKKGREYLEQMKDTKRNSPQDIIQYGMKAMSSFYNAGSDYDMIGEDRLAERDYRLCDRIKMGVKKAVDALPTSDRRGELSRNRISKLTSGIIGLIGIIGGLFFLSTNMTGNAIADLTTKTTSFLGAGLLIVGLVAGFFWIKSRKSN